MLVNRPLSNTELNQIIGKLGLGSSNIGIVPKKDLSKLKFSSKKPFQFAIVNLMNSKTDPQGTHWTTIVIFNRPRLQLIIAVDSFGMRPDASTVKYMKQKRFANYKRLFFDTQVQDNHALSCGFWALFFVNELQKANSLRDVVKLMSQFETRSPDENERDLQAYFNRLTI